MSRAEISPFDQQSVTKHLSASERAFLDLLLSKCLFVVYEPTLFTAEIDGQTSTTKPDFKVINPRHPHPTPKYVEITTHDCPHDQQATKQDPKWKQRAVMRKNGVTHVVLYRPHLANCQRHHPELDFDIKHRRCRKK